MDAGWKSACKITLDSEKVYTDVYDLKTGELVEVPERIKDVTNYMK